MSKRKVWIGNWLPLLVFIFVVLFSCYTAYYFAYHITDSDAARELELGKLLADENKLVTSNWYYSTEIRFFGTNLVYMPLFKILQNWPLIRFLSIIIFQLLLLISYLYFSRCVKLSWKAYFISAALLLLPTGIVYGRIVLYQNYYIPCLVYGFLIAGLSLAILEHHGQHKRMRQGLRVAAMIVLSFISCLNGFRQLPATMVPLLVTAIMVLLQKRVAKAALTNDFRKISRLHIALVCGVCLAGAAGLLIHTLVLPQYLSFRQMNQTAFSLVSPEGIRDIGVGYLSLFGYQQGRTLFSLEWVLALSGAFIGMLVLLVSLSAIRTERNTVSYADAFCALLFPLSILCMTAVFLFLPDQTNYPQYYLPVFVWFFPWLGLQIRRLQAQPKRYSIRQATVVVTCLVLFGNGIYHNVFILHPDGKQVVYDPSIDIAARSHLNGVVEFVQENELDVGYATFWNAGILTEMTSGQIPMITIDRVYPYAIYTNSNWLMNKQNRALSFVEDKDIFLLLTHDESYVFYDCELAAYAIPVYDDAYYRIFVFDFSTEIWEYLEIQDQIYL